MSSMIMSQNFSPPFIPPFPKKCLSSLILCCLLSIGCGLIPLFSERLWEILKRVFIIIQHQAKYRKIYWIFILNTHAFFFYENIPLFLKISLLWIQEWWLIYFCVHVSSCIPGNEIVGSWENQEDQGQGVSLGS